MYTQLLDLCLVAILLRIGQASSVAGKLFSSLGRYGMTGTWAPHTFTANCLGECALMCEKKKLCATFSFDKSSRTCHLSARAPAGMFGLHTDNCPYESGYLLYLQKKKRTCLKYYYPPMNQTQAAEKCNGDGAHLLTIEDGEMAKLVGDILKSNDWNDVWLDAYDYDRDGFFNTSSGKPLPYVPTGSKMNEGEGEYCLRFVKEKNLFNDRFCNYVFNALCEIYV